MIKRRIERKEGEWEREGEIVKEKHRQVDVEREGARDG